MALRAAVVGIASYYSMEFAAAMRALGQDGRVELVGAAHLGAADEILANLNQLTRKAYRERYQVPLFERAEHLLQETRPQLVLVTAPDRDKPRYVVQALQAGADVFISKPFAGSLEGAATIRDAARARPGQLTGGLNPARFASEIREAYHRVHDGEIGEILTARAWIQHGQGKPNRKGSPEFDDGQGGIEYSLGLYAADLLNWFVDAPANPAVRAFAEYDTLNTPGYPWMDSGKAVVRYGASRMGSAEIHYSVQCGAPPWEVEIGGREGMIRATGGSFGGIVWRKSAPTPAGAERFSPPRRHVMQAVLADVLEGCEQRRPFEMDADAGFRAIELCEAWKRSAASHEAVRLPLPHTSSDR